MVAMAQARLGDAKLENLSAEGRFTSAYNAAHAAALVSLLIVDVDKLIKP